MSTLALRWCRFRHETRRAWLRVRRAWRQYWCRQAGHQPVRFRSRLVTNRWTGLLVRRPWPWREQLVLLQETDFERDGLRLRCDRCGRELAFISQREIVQLGHAVDWSSLLRKHYHQHQPPGWVDR